MESLNKQFTYRGYKFNINIKLNTKVEKRINGERWHTVTVTDVNESNTPEYLRVYELNDKLIETAIPDYEWRAKQWADDKIDGKIDVVTKLNRLGFE